MLAVSLVGRGVDNVVLLSCALILLGGGPKRR